MQQIDKIKDYFSSQFIDPMRSKLWYILPFNEHVLKGRIYVLNKF